MVTLNLIEGYAGYGRRRRRSLTKHLIQTRAYKQGPTRLPAPTMVKLCTLYTSLRNPNSSLTPH